MKKYSALFFASFFVLIFFAFFQQTPLAQAFYQTGQNCNLDGQNTTDVNYYKHNCTSANSSAQCTTVSNEICKVDTDACLPYSVNGTIKFHCVANKLNNTKTLLDCSCESSQSKTNNKFKCVNDSTKQPVTGSGGKTEDACPNNNVCIKGTPGKNGDILTVAAGESIFDPTKYIVSGVVCTPQNQAAVGACTCDPKDPTKFSCKNSKTGKSASDTCGQNNVCKPTTPASQLVDRGQIANSTTFMSDSTLEGISCQHATATCTCGNANQDGSVTCTLLGKKSTANCGNSNVCQNDASNTLSSGDLESLPNGYANITMKGVKCTSPAKISLPPPPSPPCVTWVNGQCTLFDSAFGNLSTNPAQFIQAIFALLLSISGGIALLLIIRAGYQLMTSQGKPDQINQARDQLIAAIVGLVFLIFSFVFLELIGVDILHIPGFGNAAGGGPAANCSCVDTTIAGRGGANNTIGSGSCPKGQVQICH